MNATVKLFRKVILFSETYSFNAINYSPQARASRYFFCSKTSKNQRSSNEDVSVKTLSSPVYTTLVKKRVPKKNKLLDSDVKGFRVAAFSTSEEYDLESLMKRISTETTFKQTTFNVEYGNLTNTVHAVSYSEENSESQHLFFFREGSVVMWNLSDIEIVKILNFIKDFENNSFQNDIIKEESEIMKYSYSLDVSKTGVVGDSILFSNNTNAKLEKYTISNAMALSVHLGTYEAILQQYIESMEPITEDLKCGKIVKITRDEVLRKIGQLFALRHNINLSSDLLDTPDFYWDRPELESLYQATFNYFCINKRTRVMNEKINHCIELVELLSSHLNDKHHIRLEWMIIILIMIEVAFEVLHYSEKFLETKEKINVFY